MMGDPAVPAIVQLVGFSSLSFVANDSAQLHAPAVVGVTVTVSVVLPPAFTEEPGAVVNVAVQLTSALIVGVPTVSGAVPVFAI